MGQGVVFSRDAWDYNEQMIQLIIAGLLLGLPSCSQGVWQALVYPDRGNLTNHLSIGEFQNLEECRDHVTAWLEDRHLSEVGDYACGWNCEYQDGIYICEEIAQWTALPVALNPK